MDKAISSSAFWCRFVLLMHCGVVVDFGAKCCHLMVVYRSGSYIGGRGMAYAPLSEKDGRTIW
ncbi:hypothetical protein NCPHL90_00903 [Corynebacterium diphtheriae]|nr:hypothetical protein NCPHL90_00903 [Corynebacterium diphtheriae]